MTERAGFATAFLAYHGWGAADRAPLAGDASERSYQRLTLGRRTAVIMDSPPGQADDPADFVRIAAHLNRLGLSAPRILAQDLARGFLLLEDFGNAVLARLLTFEPAREAALYALATDVLIHLQAHPAPAPPARPFGIRLGRGGRLCGNVVPVCNHRRADGPRRIHRKTGGGSGQAC